LAFRLVECAFGTEIAGSVSEIKEHEPTGGIYDGSSH